MTNAASGWLGAVALGFTVTIGAAAGSEGPPAPEVVEVPVVPSLGMVVQMAYEPTGRQVWVATANGLYRVPRDGDRKPVTVVEPRSDLRIALAPDGSTYAIFSPSPRPGEHFSARVVPTTGGAALDLAVSGGLSGLALGARRGILVARTPLDNPESFRVPYRCTFFPPGGARREIGPLEGPHSWILDPAGRAVLLLGRSEARAYSEKGDEVWGEPIRGSFGPGALGPGGTTAVLYGDGTETQGLLVRTGAGELRTVPLHAPPDELRVAVDGSVALVVFADGRFSILDLATRELSPPRAVPIADVGRVTDVEILRGGKLVFGVLLGTPKAPPRRGSVVALSSAAQEQPLLRSDLTIEAPTACLPAIDAQPGSRTFVARSDVQAVFVDLGGE